MIFQLTALKPTSDEYKEINITEWAWRPMRSILAIGNHLSFEKNGKYAIHLDRINDLDCSMGEGIEKPEVCRELADHIKNLSSDPLSLESFGMSVEILDGEFYFTYPPALCTSAMQHKESKNLINDTVDEDEYDEVCSLFRTSEIEMNDFVNFLNNCGGFLMP